MQNSGFSTQWLYELKQKNDIVSIVGKYIRLEKKGGKYWACCPFHNEKTPSFVVSEDGFFYCFGCKESGDVISFIMKYESCDFGQAIEILAKNAGMEVPKYTGENKIFKKKEKKDKILKILSLTQKHYQENLYTKRAKQAQDYIKLRKLTRHELEDFKLGYSFGYNELITYLKSQGFTEQDMLDAGVAGKRNDKYYDVMAERLIFPIFNAFDECVGFSARYLGKTDYAKYKNTAETDVFQKGKIVFGINLVKHLKQSQGIDNLIVVEGQMDVIAMHKAGFKTTVACMGTALTKDNALQLKKLSENIILCFDGDGAGQKATIKSIDILREVGVNIKIVFLPDGKDPDEILNAFGKDYLANLIENALSPIDYLIEIEKKKFNLEKTDEKTLFVTACLNHIAKLESESAEDIYLEKLRDLTSIPIDILRRDIIKLKKGINRPQTKEKIDKDVLISRENGNIRAIKYILASLIFQKDFVDKRIDYKRLLPKYSEVINLAYKKTPISTYFDLLDVEEFPLLKDCFNVEFEKFKGNEKGYFEQCLWFLINQEYIKLQNEITEEFKSCKDLDNRRKLMERLNKITKSLKEKNMEEFYAR